MMNIYQKAWSDIKRAFIDHALWRTLAWYDIRARYRRSALGPFWITISMAVTIAAMGPLYGSLFNFDPSDFVPHLALGLIFWALLSSCVNDSASTFSDAAHYMKQTFIPAPIFVLRIMYRQILVLGHNLIIYPIVALILWNSFNENIFWFFPALALVFANLVSISMLISILCARFRDMAPILNSIMSLLFFITPIIWRVEQLPEGRQYLLSWNFFAIYLDLLRKPFLGQVPNWNEWSFAIVSSIILGIAAFLIYAKTRHRITYWL